MHYQCSSIVMSALLMAACTGNDVQEEVIPEEPVVCAVSDDAVSLQSQDIAGTWKNIENYPVGPGDLVERTMTFSADNVFESFSIKYNGCPYEYSGVNENPDLGCDGWYSSESTERGTYSINGSVVTLFSNESQERLLVSPTSAALLISIGEVCNIEFIRN